MKVKGILSLGKPQHQTSKSLAAGKTITMAAHHQLDTVKRKWYHIKWFADTDTPRERRLIMKLDLLIVPYAFLAYWIKYIDQSNLSTSSLFPSFPPPLPVLETNISQTTPT